VRKGTRRSGFARLFVRQDPDDPLLFVVSGERGEDAIPVIPTAKAHAMWSLSETRSSDRRRRGRNHPSVVADELHEPLTD